MCGPGTDREAHLTDTRGQQTRVSAMRNDARVDSAYFALLALELDPFFPSLPVRAASTRTNLTKILRHPRAFSVLHIPAEMTETDLETSDWEERKRALRKEWCSIYP
jgi:hypothetical protein